MKKLIHRFSERTLYKLAQKYPVVTINGPRQSGKTTLCRMTFPDFSYVSLEEPDVREFALNDPRGFLGQFSSGVIIDEIQKVPDITSYIQTKVDNPDFSGKYILTGSQNFTVTNTVNQSLAGRTALLTLLPFSNSEIQTFLPQNNNNSLIYTGGYPRIFHRDLNPTKVFSDYVSTYLERDLRQLLFIRDLALFQKFLGLCAGRTGQILNYSSLSNDTGVTQTTIKEWLSLLEASYICFRLPPFFRNISKRLIKSPKIYFYDVGLAAFLMGINSVNQIATHPLRGMLFENLIVLELLKLYYDKGINRPNFTFYRDSNGNEVDIIIPNGAELIPIEIKSGNTINSAFFRNLGKFSDLFVSSNKGMLVYGGKATRIQNKVTVTNINDLPNQLNKIFV